MAPEYGVGSTGVLLYKWRHETRKTSNDSVMQANNSIPTGSFFWAFTNRINQLQQPRQRQHAREFWAERCVDRVSLFRHPRPYPEYATLSSEVDSGTKHQDLRCHCHRDTNICETKRSPLSPLRQSHVLHQVTLL